MRNDGEMLQLLAVHISRFGKISNINNIGKKHMIDRQEWRGPHHRHDHSFVDVDKHVRNETKLTQLKIDIPEEWLPFIHSHKQHFGLNNRSFSEVRFSVLKNRQLGSLDIDFQIINGIDLGDIIQAMGRDRNFLNNAPHSENCGKCDSKFSSGSNRLVIPDA